MTSVMVPKEEGKNMNESQKTICELLSYHVRPSDDSLKKRIRRTTETPKKPSLQPTMTTPFELIDIQRKTRKNAGCHEDLKDGPDSYSRYVREEKLCIRQEHDLVFITSSNSWKKTFDNKQYHVL